MKKLITISLLSLFLVTPFFTFAATSTGLTPNSPFYFFDTLSEKIVLFFTFSPEKKAIKALDYAEKRLAEVKTLTEEGGNADAIKTSIANYERNIALAAEKSKEVKNEGQKENLLNLVTDNASKNQETLAAVLIKVPEEAKQAITQAIEASKKGQEEAQKQIAELKQEITALKQEVADLKKQQKIEPASVQDVDTKTSIKELKEEIKELKKQTEAPAVPAVSATPTITSQIEVKSEDLPLILTNSAGRSFPIDNPTMNRQRVQDLIDVGFFVTQGKLPEGIFRIGNETSVTPTTPATPATPAVPSIPATTPAIPATPATPATSITQTGETEIFSITVTPSLTSAKIEFQTNILTNAKIFSNGTVYSSISGLSTRHIVNITGLTSGTNYSYEIEVVSDNKVTKKQGSFITKPDDYTITIQPDKTSVPASGWSGVTFKVSTFKNGQIQANQSVLMTTPDPTKNDTRTTSNQTGNNSGDWYNTFTYYPKTVGTHTLVFSWNGVSKSINIQATEYIKVIPKFEQRAIYQQDVNNNSYPVEVPEYLIGYQNATIASFSLSDANEAFRIGDIKFDSDIDSNKLSLPVGSYNGSLYKIQIRDTTGVSIGTHTFTIKEIIGVGQISGNNIVISGLPVTFTFIIKDIPEPEIIPIKTFYSYTGSIHQGNPGVIGSFKIKMNPNSNIQLLCKAINAASGASFSAYIYAETANGRVGVCPNPWFSNVGKEYPTGSDGVSVIQYSLWIDTLYLDNSYLTANSNILKFNIEDLKVKDMKTGIIKSVSSIPTFELEFVKP